MTNEEKAIAFRVIKEIRDRIIENSDQLGMRIPQMDTKSAIAYQCEVLGLATARRICGHIYDAIQDGSLKIEVEKIEKKCDHTVFYSEYAAGYVCSKCKATILPR